MEENINIKPNKNLIKKFKSAYIIYCGVRRPILKRQHPNLLNQEITRLIAKEWKFLNKEEKELYKKLENEGKAKFEKAKEHFEYKYKASRKLRKPVRFRTPYMFFVMKNKDRLNNEEKYLNIENIRELATTWKNMSEEEKEPYIQLSKDDKERYQHFRKLN